MADDCLICRKHAGEGPLVAPMVWSDDVIVVTHIPPVGDETSAFVGHLVVETRRHAPYIDDLTEEESAAVGRAVRVAARALRHEFSPEYVFSGVIGVGVAHFHQHVWPKHPGTPGRYAWHSVDEWPGAPRAAGGDLDAVCDRLRPHFE